MIQFDVCIGVHTTERKRVLGISEHRSVYQRGREAKARHIATLRADALPQVGHDLRFDDGRYHVVDVVWCQAPSPADDVVNPLVLVRRIV